MTVRFEAPCSECLEPITYVASRPVAHDCVTDDNDNEEND